MKLQAHFLVFIIIFFSYDPQTYQFINTENLLLENFVTLFVNIFPNAIDQFSI